MAAAAPVSTAASPPPSAAVPESTISEPTVQPAAWTAASSGRFRATPAVSRATPAARQAETPPASSTATTPEPRRATPPIRARTAASATPTPRRTRTNGPRVGTDSLQRAEQDNGDPRSLGPPSGAPLPLVDTALPRPGRDCTLHPLSGAPTFPGTASSARPGDSQPPSSSGSGLRPMVDAERRPDGRAE